MRFPAMSWLALFSILFSVSLSADDQTDEKKPAVKTAKERLVSKAADAQRMNDCKVPVEQRDAEHPRPDDCGNAIEAETSGGSADPD